jgi:PKD repeat protein
VVDLFGQFGIADERVHVTGGGGSGSSSPPVASFTFSPSAPKVGEMVAFTSTSTDPENDIEDQEWDLDGDGAYDDAHGPTARRSFGTAGSHTVGLRVTDKGGQTATASAPVTVMGTSLASPPAASFTFAPANPVVGQSVAFTSTATDTDGNVANVIWDLDNDGQLDDATGPTAAWTFSAAGTHTVTMQATDDGGLSSFVSRNLEVRAAGPGVPSLSTFNPATLPVTRVTGVTRSRTRPRLLNPFPVIRIRGELVRRGVLVQILSVRSGPGTLVSARCKGAGCPLKAARARVRPGRHGLRIRAFERWLPAGLLIEIRVTKPHRIGKLTRFRIRQGRPPARRDLCVGPVSGRPVNCR